MADPILEPDETPVPTKVALPSGATLQVKGEPAAYVAGEAGKPPIRPEVRHLWPLKGQTVEVVIKLDGQEVGSLGPWTVPDIPEGRAAVAQIGLVVSADAEPVEAK